ncbi:MAG TPA: carbohydrate-binding domain-containing protein [Tepidisphaeraceae bacterium]|nr:carbohydrate-binding domain-containing protein [Tepidisphaeraceae bacterium]
MRRRLNITIIAITTISLFAIVRGDDTGKSKPPASAPAEAVPEGTLLLKPQAARIHGFRLKLDPKPVPTLIFWVDPNEYIEWPKAAKKGKYTVEVTYSCAPNAGGEFMVKAAANKVVAYTKNTKDWHTFQTLNIGTLTVLNDNTSIALRSTGNISRVLMNVRGVKLTMVKEEKKK